MAEIIHFPPCDPDDTQALYASALARAGYNTRMRKAVEDAYAAGYLAACQEAVQMAQKINKLLQEMNTLAQERLWQTQREIQMLTGGIKLLPKA